MRNALSLSVVFILLGCTSLRPKIDSCAVQTRAAVDIGSGSTKELIADVSSCGPEIQSIRWQHQERVDYRDSIERSKTREIPAETEAAGLAALEKLTAMRASIPYESGQGVATAAFRAARNGQRVINRLGEKTGLKLQVISQATEALLGFELARRKLNIAPEGVLVWDVGGGSQQMTWKGANGLEFAMSETASVTFKNLVLKTVRPKLKSKSPNPMSKVEVARAIDMASKLARRLPRPLIEKLRAEAFQIVGIGGVHGKSVLPQTKKDESFTQDDLEVVLEQRRKLEDKELGSYPDTAITNLILVLGFMKELAIRRVVVLDVDLTQAVLLFPHLITPADSETN